MPRLPERWTLLVNNPEQVQDESTGNWFPGKPTPVPWTGLLQQRQLSAASVDAGNTELAAGHVVSSYVLLLDPVCGRSRRRRTRSATRLASCTRSRAGHGYVDTPAALSVPPTSPRMFARYLT